MHEQSGITTTGRISRRKNVYAGLAAGYALFDEFDCSDERKTTGFQLPSGPCDVTLAFGDKVFDAKGQLVYDFFNLDGILGDKYTVNGKIQPFDVEPRKYRFRLLDGGRASASYAFALSDGTPLIQVSTTQQPAGGPGQTPVCHLRRGRASRRDHRLLEMQTRHQAVSSESRRADRQPRSTGKLLTPGISSSRFRVGLFNAQI